MKLQMKWSDLGPLTTTVVNSTVPFPKPQWETIPRNRVYTEVAKQLQTRIVNDLKPGDMLPPERELVQLLGVSRGSVREAIRSLELMGLLEPQQGVGTVVREPSAGQVAAPITGVLLQKRAMIRELLDVRKVIEPALARRAAEHASAADIADLEAVLERQEVKLDNREPAVEEDSEFHYGIALAANNSVLLRIVDILMDLLRETRERSLQVQGRQQKSLAGHRRILAALRQKDAGSAESAMRRHLSEIEKIVLKKL